MKDSGFIDTLWIIWKYKYWILLFILLCVITVVGVYSVLFFVSDSYDENGEYQTTKLTLSVFLVCAMWGFVFYKINSLTKKVYYLEKIVQLFYALNPKIRAAIRPRYDEHQNPIPESLRNIDSSLVGIAGIDAFCAGDIAQLVMIKYSMNKEGHDSGFWPAFKNATEIIACDGTLLELERVEGIISTHIKPSVRRLNKKAICVLKFKILFFFLKHGLFGREKIFQELNSPWQYDDKPVVDFTKFIAEEWLNTDIKRKYYPSEDSLEQYLIGEEEKYNAYTAG